MPTALITGVSSGIGLELARVIAREGYGLVLVARNQKRLEEIAQELRPAEAQVIGIDLSLPGAPEEIHGKVPAVDVLVNNAGFGVFGKFADKGLAEELNMMQLNMTALVAPGPLMAIYFATKAFVLSFSEAIANELEGTGVIVSALCPGPTASDFQERAKMQNSGLVKGKKMMDSRTVAEIG
jgi:uncharacterized protein